MMKTVAGTCASLSVSLLTTSFRLSNHFLLYTPIDLRFRLYQQYHQNLQQTYDLFEYSRYFGGVYPAMGVARFCWSLVVLLSEMMSRQFCKHGYRPATIKLWHIAGSKRRCWLREKTMKCLWQEASTLRQRQQNSAFNCTQWQICSLHN